MERGHIHKPLTMSLVSSGLTQPLLDGEAVPEGAECVVSAAKSTDANSRQMLTGAFDVAEMSFATFVKGREQGRDLVGLPIFTGRGFLQPGVLCSAAAGITTAEDICGKRVGLPQFWMTSSVWHRGILRQQHGIDQDAVKWFTAVDERFEGTTTPAGVDVRRLREGLSVHDALQAGEVDAIMVPPRGAASALREGVERPYTDVVEAQRAYFRETGVFPIMHFVVMRQSLYEAEPWLAESLFSAFVAAKRRAVAQDSLPAGIGDIPANELWTYGLAKNRPALETFMDFAGAQGWLAQPTQAEDVFVSSAAQLEE